MDKEFLELTPQQILKHAKKHPHSVNVSTEAFTVGEKDYVVHNISLKGDPNNDFDVANYRRGLTFIQEIINFKQQNLRVAKKGLRKFYDLIPEFLGQKISYISNSKYYGSIKNKIFQPLKQDAESFVLYSTEKANGQNAQISWDEEGQFWVIGSKNKSLLLKQIKDVKYITHKYEHVRTISIAQQWFRFLQENQDKVEQIKSELSKYVLVGEICDSVKSGHIVDYGQKTKLYFYALVNKNQRQYSCQPPSQFIKFAKEVNLEKQCVRFDIIELNSYEALKEQLKKQMFRIYEGSMQKYGEGTVVYVTIKNNGQQHCQSICKIKTLQYRIYRKLRQKLKVYFQKYRKTYQKLLNKYIEEVKQLTKGFKTPKPEEYYFKIAQKGFKFCEDQQKAISKFFHNKYISFLKLIQNEKIDKEAFKQIVHQQMGNTQISKMIQQRYPQQINKIQMQQKTKESNSHQNHQIQQNKEQVQKRNVIVFIPLSIPATGKSTLFKKIQQTLKQYRISILSSDKIRQIKTQQLMKKQKNLSKKAAFQKSREATNKQFYKQLHQILGQFSNQKTEENCILFLDKNHPQNGLKKSIEQINRGAQKCKNLSVKIGCILPKCRKLINEKSKFMYPFSESYVACCLKRVISRQQHQTLQGTPIQRANVCINFANMFRNFTISEYNLSKYFKLGIRLPYTKQQQVPGQISSAIIKIMLGSKPGSFDEHPALQNLVAQIQKWKYQQVDFDKQINQIAKQFQQLFQNFDNLKIDLSTLLDQKQDKKQE